MKTTTADSQLTIPAPPEQVLGRVLGDLGGALISALGFLGDQLGLFRILADGQPRSYPQLAKEADLDERYVLEWLKAMVAGAYVECDQECRYWMTTDQISVLGEESSPFFHGGAFQFAIHSIYNVPRLLQTFRAGGGIPYDEIGGDVHCAIERIFAPGYRHQMKRWLSSVPGLGERLNAGLRVADVGCGRGQSSVQIAKAFPNSEVSGFDNHGPSIASALKLATDSGTPNLRFRQLDTLRLTEEAPFDLICAFDTIHDMIDPVGGLRAIRASLNPGGLLFWCEPNASHDPLENRNPLGRYLHAVSPMHCMTVSLAHHGAALGTVIGEKGARELAVEAGFRSFTRLPVDDPLNMFFAVSDEPAPL